MGGCIHFSLDNLLILACSAEDWFDKNLEECMSRATFFTWVLYVSSPNTFTILCAILYVCMNFSSSLDLCFSPISRHFSILSFCQSMILPFKKLAGYTSYKIDLLVTGHVPLKPVTVVLSTMIPLDRRTGSFMISLVLGSRKSLGSYSRDLIMFEWKFSSYFISWDLALSKWIPAVLRSSPTSPWPSSFNNSCSIS